MPHRKRQPYIVCFEFTGTRVLDLPSPLSDRMLCLENELGDSTWVESFSQISRTLKTEQGLTSTFDVVMILNKSLHCIYKEPGGLQR